MEFNGTFLVTIVSFIVFVFVMNKILYEPIGRIVAERQDFVDGNLRSADENRKRASEISIKKEEKICRAKNEAKDKYSDAVSEYKVKKNDIIKNAQDESGNRLNDAYERLNGLANETKQGVKDRMTDLANNIVEKVLGYRSEVHGFDNDTVDRILYR